MSQYLDPAFEETRNSAIYGRIEDREAQRVNDQSTEQPTAPQMRRKLRPKKPPFWMEAPKKSLWNSVRSMFRKRRASKAFDKALANYLKQKDRP